MKIRYSDIKKIIVDFSQYYQAASELWKASICYFLCSFLQKGISVLTTPIFTRLLTTEEYGEYVLFTSWADVLGIFITFGLATSVYQKKLVEIAEEKEKDIFTSSLIGLMMTLAVISFILYYIFHNPLNRWLNLSTDRIIAIYISSVVSAGFGFWAMRQRVDYRYKKLIMLTLFITFCKPIAGIVCIYLFPEYKVLAKIYSLVVVEVIGYISLLVFQIRKGKIVYCKKYWKYALAYVIPLIPHYLSQRVLSQSDRIMISHLSGPDAAGIYGLANSAGMILNLLLAPSDSTIAPWIYKKIHDRNYNRIYQFSIYPILIMALICLIFISVAPELIRFFAPESYYEGSYLIPPFAISTYFMLIYCFFIYFEYYYEKTVYVMIATVSSALLNIILNYIFIKYVGYEAAAYTSLFCYIACAFFHYLVMKKICRENGICEPVYNTKIIVAVSVLLMGSGIAITALYNYILLRYFIIFSIATGIVIFRKKIYVVIKDCIEKI